MHSEELLTLDIALQYCDELKTQLSDAIGHIAELNKRYNYIDYMENIRMLEKSRAELSPYIDHLHSQLSLSPNSLSPFVLASSSPVNHHHHQYSTKLRCSTPIVSAKICRALDLSPIHKPTNNTNEGDPTHFSTTTNSSAKRSVQDIKQNNNTIAVRALKVQRNIETMLNHLKVLQKIHQRNHVIALEQSLYQSCNHSLCGAASPGKLGHTHCDSRNWSINDTSYNSFNISTNMTPKKKQSHPYMTPLRKIQMQAIASHAVLLRSC